MHDDRDASADDIFAAVARRAGGFDLATYRRLVGHASEFKEGDAARDLHAPDPAARAHARACLARTRVRDLDAHPLLADELHAFLEQGRPASPDRTLGELADFLLHAPLPDVHAVLPALSSQTIGCLVKLLDEPALVALGARLHHPLPGSDIGAPGVLSARLQPNSPTDHPDDLRWQVFSGWSYGVGDLLLGTNPVSSDLRSLAAVEATLHDLRVRFGLEDALPHCVLAHIDLQAAVEAAHPGTTGLWFQSIAGDDPTNATFGLTLAGLCAHADARDGRWGLYFETGQGSEVTNGHGGGVDMVALEARKYGLARALARRVAAARARAGRDPAAWVHVNDVAGFIGPEVLRTRDQLVRCCLEDLVMGKLHGLTVGLDVCATFHMAVTPDDLDHCLDRIVPAAPAYLMALPSKHDPMLSYLTTGFHDHLRLRARHGLRVGAAMHRFFRDVLQVVDDDGRPGPHFGDPRHVFLLWSRAGGDLRPDAELRAEADARLAAVRARGVPIAEGHGAAHFDPPPALDAEVRALHEHAKAALRAELPDEWIAALPDALVLRSRAVDRDDHILHPTAGEQLAPDSEAALLDLRARQAGAVDVQILVSDGLNARALTDPGHLAPFLAELRAGLLAAGHRPGDLLVLRAGRVRAGYRAGELLFADLPGPAPRVLVHAIGERPGTVHHNYSVYITAAAPALWSRRGAVDHAITRVVSGVSDTALDPVRAAREVLAILAAGAPPAPHDMSSGTCH
jgi:ethanolamine ammonia-lyase large subunit